MRKKINSKPIASGKNITTIENLPFPHVLYPGRTTFFGFKKNESSEIYFCACSYEAIGNYIELRKKAGIPLNSHPERMFILDSFDFPLAIVSRLMKLAIPQEKVLSNLKFKEKLCHECNHETPSYRYCHEMYGTIFKQNFGWYINKQSLEWGIHPLHKMDEQLLGKMPEELLTLFLNTELQKIITEERNLADELNHLTEKNLMESDKFKETLKAKFHLNRSFSKYYRKITRVIENEVRRKFGYKNIGEAWTSETILYYITKKLFPRLTIHRHFRPPYLKGLELDIFIEELNLGIEYQGVQHYKPIKYWGGIEAFTEQRKRDKLKQKLCSKLGINLIYFEYYESLNHSTVKDKVLPFLK